MDKAGAEEQYEGLKAECEAQMRLDVCDGCTACALRCAADVPASQEEWDTLQAHLAQVSDEERASITAIEAQDKTVSLGDGVTVEMCRYFDMATQRCAIYPVRPLACRLLGHVEWMPCPIEKVPRPIPTNKALTLLRSYSHFERKTFAEWETQENRQD